MENVTNEKILVFTDVHGNLEALKSLMKTKDYKTATKRIFLGDAVAMGGNSKECLEIILNSADVFLLGNHDFYLAFGLPKDMKCSERKLAHQAFVRSQVPEDLRERLKTVPREFYYNICGKRLYFTHYIWKETDIDDELEGQDLTAENLDKKFKDIDADIIFHGHDHYPSHYVSKAKEYYIVGSLGMKLPAKYIVITSKAGEVKIEHKTLKYNVEKAIKDMLRQGYPRAEEYSKFFYN